MFGGNYEKQNEDYATITEGRYAVLLENATIEQTKSGTDYIQMVFIINGGEFDKRKIWHKLWMTEKAYNMAAQQLDNVYVFKKIRPSETIAQFMNSAADAIFELVGKRFEIEVQGHDEYNGKLYPKTFLTGYLDTPNLAVQQFPAQSEEVKRPSGPVPQASMIKPPEFYQNEEIPF